MWNAGSSYPFLASLPGPNLTSVVPEGAACCRRRFKFLVWLVPMPGFEPGTYLLRISCSTAELHRRGAENRGGGAGAQARRSGMVAAATCLERRHADAAAGGVSGRGAAAGARRADRYRRYADGRGAADGGGLCGAGGVAGGGAAGDRKSTRLNSS